MLISRHQGLLGTVVELRLQGVTDAATRDCERSAIAEIKRLQHVLNSYDESSEFCGWRSGEADPGPELTEVLALTARWHERTDGAFNVSAGALTALWDEAAVKGELPDPNELRAAAQRCVDIPYGVDKTTVAMCDERRSVDVNGLAKGWIMDHTVDMAFAHPGILDVMINAGGDLRHKGPLGVRIGIEDPTRPYDNVAPAAALDLRNRGLATSGRGRRGWRIAGRQFGHIIDPRSGWPADGIASTTVIADDATTADAVATTLAVLGFDDGLAFATTIDGVGCLLIGSDGTVVSNGVWTAAAIT